MTSQGIAQRLWPANLALRAATLSVAANFGLMVVKVAAGLITGSIAVLSDGIDSAQDLIAASIAYVSVRIGSRPADEEHPYGHGRAETIAAAIQASLIAAGGVFIAYSAIHRLDEPPESIGSDLGIAVMLLAAAVNLGVARYASRAAAITRSPAVASDARHLMANVVQAGAILAGLALVELTGEVAIDALMALALAIYLFWTAGTILWAVAGEMLDVSLSPEEVEVVRGAILAEGDEIAGYHRLRTRRSGQVPHVDLHLMVRPDLSVEESHAITERIEERIHRRWPRATVVIHVEPADGRPLRPWH